MMNSAKILLIDDNLPFQTVFSDALQEEGFQVKVLGRGKEALQNAATWLPDIILCDYGLPDIDGFEICRLLKRAESTRHIPLLLITGKIWGLSSESDLISALELGAEDLIAKPFNLKFLVAKLHSILRRQSHHQASNPLSSDEPDSIELHGISLDRKKYRVFAGKTEVKLTTTQFKLLECLAARPGIAFSRISIVTSLNQQDYAITEDSVDVHIACLRKKLGQNWGSCIETLRGIGYRMKEILPAND